MPYNTARKYYEGIQTRKDIYLYIIRYLKEHDYPPSIPDIAAGLNISNHTVQNHFGELLENGLLETDNPRHATSVPGGRIQVQKGDKKMSSKLKVKKKTRFPVQTSNQAAQAFGRAMQNCQSQLKDMEQKAYEDGFTVGEDWSNTINTVTTMMALRSL